MIQCCRLCGVSINVGDRTKRLFSISAHQYFIDGAGNTRTTCRELLTTVCGGCLETVRAAIVEQRKLERGPGTEEPRRQVEAGTAGTT